MALIPLCTSRFQLEDVEAKSSLLSLLNKQNKLTKCQERRYFYTYFSGKYNHTQSEFKSQVVVVCLSNNKSSIYRVRCENIQALLVVFTRCRWPTCSWSSPACCVFLFSDHSPATATASAKHLNLVCGKQILLSNI